MCFPSPEKCVFLGSGNQTTAFSLRFSGHSRAICKAHENMWSLDAMRSNRPALEPLTRQEPGTTSNLAPTPKLSETGTNLEPTPELASDPGTRPRNPRLTRPEPVPEPPETSPGNLPQALPQSLQSAPNLISAEDPRADAVGEKSSLQVHELRGSSFHRHMQSS